MKNRILLSFCLVLVGVLGCAEQQSGTQTSNVSAKLFEGTWLYSASETAVLGQQSRGPSIVDGSLTVQTVADMKKNLGLPEVAEDTKIVTVGQITGFRLDSAGTREEYSNPAYFITNPDEPYELQLLMFARNADNTAWDVYRQFRIVNDFSGKRGSKQLIVGAEAGARPSTVYTKQE